jgi:hypothetical protein
VRRLLLAALILSEGCSGYGSPTPEDLGQLGLTAAAVHPDTVRYRVHLSIDSRWLAGEFDGVVVGRLGRSPVARAQLFGDVGPKTIDLLARPDRIVGYFPQSRAGIDCGLPGEAVPHPLLFLGVSLLEDLADIGEDRVLGIRQDREGWWLNLRPLVPGMRSEALHAADGRTIERRFRWMYGITWTERWESPDACTIRASGLVLRVRLLGTEPLAEPPVRAFDLPLPRDIRIIEGSRK